MKKDLLQGLAGGVMIGAAVGYLIAEKLIAGKYEGRIEEEVTSAREVFARLNKVDQYATPAQAAKALQAYGNGGVPVTKFLEEHNGTKPASVEGDPILVEGEPMNRNVFEDNSGIVDEGVRDPSKPYIISVDEYAEDAKYDKISLTYYKGDDTLADDQDGPIDNIDEVVGQDCLDKFGQGSKDKHVVFVRNEKKGADYEVYCDERNFTEAVFGVIPEDDSDSRKRARKMREDD